MHALAMAGANFVAVATVYTTAISLADLKASGNTVFNFLMTVSGIITWSESLDMHKISLKLKMQLIRSK